MTSKITITILDDGTVKTDAREVDGTEGEIMDILNELALELNGKLEVEKHVHTHHSHHRHDANDHHHVKGGAR